MLPKASAPAYGYRQQAGSRAEASGAKVRLTLWVVFAYNLFMEKTKTAHIRLPLKVAVETQASVEAQLGVYVSKSTAVEWALQNHFLSLNVFELPPSKSK